MSRKRFAKKDGATILLATAIGFALIFGLSINSLKLRDKPPSWTITSERYGVDWQFRFGISWKIWKFDTSLRNGTRYEYVAQRNSFGAFFYERKLEGRPLPFFVPEAKLERDKLFAELD